MVPIYCNDCYGEFLQVAFKAQAALVFDCRQLNLNIALDGDNPSQQNAIRVMEDISLGEDML